MIALLLAVVANFNRMLALVIFHVLPDNFMHDVIGLFSLILYVLAPIYFLGKPYAKKFAKEYFEINPKANNRVYLQLLMPLMLLVGLLFYAGPTTNEPERNIDERLSAVQLSGFETETLPTGIVKLKNEEALIYLKPPVTGFGTTHDPRYCWNGDGYKFSHIHEVEIAGVTVYAAELNKENTKLYTLWWYDNGKEKTIQEWNWRWKSITSRRSGFSLVNITMMEEDLLHETAEQILKEKKYSSFIR